MIQRVLVVLVAAVAAWIGLVQPAQAVLATRTPIVAYTYDGQHHAAAMTCAAADRGPPGKACDADVTRDADPGSNGISARSSGPTTSDTYDYDVTALLVQVDSVTGATTELPEATDGVLSSLRRSEVAANALPALPKALSGGAADTYVYFGTRGGKNVYTGITNNLTRRGAQHGERFDQLVRVTNEPVTRGQARSIEQALIARNPGFENKINSISLVDV